MKKLFCFILSFCLLIAACGHEATVQTQPSISTQETEPTATESIAATESDPETVETIPALAYQNPLTAVSFNPISNVHSADNGTVLYRCNSAELHITMNDHTVADSIIMDFQNRSGDLTYSATAALESACEEYSEDFGWEPYFCNLKFDVARIDQTNLSLMGTETFFDATPLSGQSAFSFNYDMQTGAYLTLKDVLTEDFSADALIDCILRALEDQKDGLFEDYTETISSLFSSNTPVENWFFTCEGLNFYFNPYEIAPQNKGIIYSEIPYSELIGILNDIYFPAEAVEFTGNLIMSELSGTDTDSINQFAEAVWDDTGKQYLIYPHGTVLNLRVETGTWTKSGAFVADSVIFCAEALTGGNALMLQISEDDLGKLCITYQSGNEIIQTPWQAK